MAKKKMENEDDETPNIQRTLTKAEMQEGLITEGWGRDDSEVPETEWTNVNRDVDKGARYGG